MKKIVSIILCLTFILGLFTVNTFAYTRPENHLFALQDFETGVSKFQVFDSSLYAISQSTSQDATRGNYAELSFKGNSWQGVSTLGFSDKVKKTGDFVTIEFDFRIPSDSGEANEEYTGNLDFYLGDLKTSGASRQMFLRVQLSKMNFVSGYYGAGYHGSNQISKDVWYHVTADIAPHLNKLRVLVDSDQKRICSLYSSGTDVYKGLGANSERFAIAFGASSSDSVGRVHLDNVEVYRHSDMDGFGAGESFLNEEMNYDETTRVNPWGVWAPNSNQFVFVCANGSETRNISCISDESDTNKFMRMNSGEGGGRTYFRRSVHATKMFDMMNMGDKIVATKSSTAILYQAKLRIDDVTKTNTTSLDVIPKTADGSANASGRYIFSINPKDGIVTVGNGSEIKTYDGLKLSSKQWYTLNLFHNVASGYMRAEIVDNSGNKQVFEGNEIDANVDYGYIALVGFNNSSEQHTVIDFDDLRVYSAAVSDADTFYTLSDFAANKENGTVTATVNVSSDMTNVTSGAAKLIIASYKDHELAKLKVADVIPTTGTKTFTLEGIEDGEEVKVMLWDAATNTIVPLYAPITK